jgi:putative ABC transport system permease protein
VVTPSYFETLSIPIVHGRAFTEEEARGEAEVVVVSESTALKLWPGQEPLGQLLQGGPNTHLAQAIAVAVASSRVIGVARDARTVQLSQNDPLFVYAPLTRRDAPDQILVRTARDAGDLQPLIRTIVHSLAPTLLVQTSSLADDMAISSSVLNARMASRLASSLGLLALLLASVGIYGVMAYSVAQRTREVGIRMALGAQPRDVLRLVIGQGMRLVGAGVILGLAGGAAASRVLRSLLFDLSSFDPLAYVGVSLFLIAVAFLAIYLPARRAATADPLSALRHI